MKAATSVESQIRVVDMTAQYLLDECLSEFRVYPQDVMRTRISSWSMHLAFTTLNKLSRGITGLPAIDLLTFFGVVAHNIRNNDDRTNGDS